MKLDGLSIGVKRYGEREAGANHELAIFEDADEALGVARKLEAEQDTAIGRAILRLVGFDFTPTGGDDFLHQAGFVLHLDARRKNVSNDRVGSLQTQQHIFFVFAFRAGVTLDDDQLDGFVKVGARQNNLAVGRNELIQEGFALGFEFGTGKVKQDAFFNGNITGFGVDLHIDIVGAGGVDDFGDEDFLGVFGLLEGDEDVDEQEHEDHQQPGHEVTDAEEDAGIFFVVGGFTGFTVLVEK